MTYKHSITADKFWENSGFTTIPFAGFFAKLKSSIKLQIPIGYQDDSGFHVGVQTEQDSVQWPATW